MKEPTCSFCGAALDTINCDGSEEVVAVFHCGTQYTMQSRDVAEMAVERGRDCQKLENLRRLLINAHLRAESYRFEIKGG